MDRKAVYSLKAVAALAAGIIVAGGVSVGSSLAQQNVPAYATSKFKLNYHTAVELAELLGKDFDQFKRWCSGWSGEVEPNPVTPNERACRMGRREGSSPMALHIVRARIDPEAPGGLEMIHEVEDEIRAPATFEWLDLVAFFDTSAYRVVHDAVRFSEWMGFSNGPPSVEDGAAIFFSWAPPGLTSYLRFSTRKKFLKDWYNVKTLPGFSRAPPKLVAVTRRIANFAKQAGAAPTSSQDLGD